MPSADAVETEAERRIANAVSDAWSALCDLTFVERVQAVLHLATQIILVPVGASVDYGRPVRPPPYRHHKVERWGERKDIPVTDRLARQRQIRELLDATERQRADAIERAKAMLGHGRMAA
jgi:hypothetical protein